MHTILDSSGIIGIELAKILPNHTDKIRLVSRNPKIVNGKDELFPCYLTNLDQVKEALKGSDVAYLTVGLDYNLKVWEELWPEIMTNVIEGCKYNDCKLVFFDNVYMYDENQLPGFSCPLPFSWFHFFYN